MLEIGQTYTTTQSGIVGIIKAIDNHPSGVARVLLDVNGSERWTSVPANYMIGRGYVSSPCYNHLKQTN